MQDYNDILCCIYMLQIIVGFSGNSLVLYLYGFNLSTSLKKRPIEVIFINLSFSHIIMILFRGIPGAAHISNLTNFMSDIACKIIVYLQRVSRGLSLCTTCLLSVFQAITINSDNHRWAEFKKRVPESIAPLCIFIWVLNLLIDGVVPLHVSGPKNSTSSNMDRSLGYCIIDRYALSTSKIVIWKSYYDMMFVGIVAGSSGYMVLVLYRHHLHIQHIRNSNLNRSAYPETRATIVILLHMSIFVCFYSFSSLFSIMIYNSKNTNQMMMHAFVFFNMCYPIVSPFVLFCSDSQILNCCDSLKIKRSLLNLF